MGQCKWHKMRVKEAISVDSSGCKWALVISRMDATMSFGCEYFCRRNAIPSYLLIKIQKLAWDEFYVSRIAL
jgi:hypothetical protein